MGRLDAKDLKRIQRRLVARESTASIAANFAVSTVTIRKIRRGLARDDVQVLRPRGDKNGRSKLSYAEVQDIKDRVSSGAATQASLARELGVSRSLISRICSGKRWEEPAVQNSSPFFLTMDLRKQRPKKGSLEESDLVDAVFSHYRSEGFPTRSIAAHRVGPIFKSLVEGPSVLEGGHLKVSSRGLKLVNAFHPQIDSVRCRNTRTPTEVFGDDELLRKSILKHIRYGHHLTPQGIRYAVYHYGGAQWASNFRPAVAKALVDLLAGARVLDPCMGFGGRLLGTIAAGREYVGVDPARRTVDGSRRLVEAVAGSGASLPPITLLQRCAEDVLGYGHYGKFDLAITSPPYFDTEIYDSSPDQSSSRYPEMSSWIECFLNPLVKRTSAELKLHGYLALNLPMDLLPYVRTAGEVSGLREVVTFDYDLYVRQFRQAKQGRTRSEPLILMQKIK